ncbi:MAG TPA: response regulator transcription factor [Actinomycetota bacterium]|jgi:DNA-binding NarL/FixJ family response regulator
MKERIRVFVYARDPISEAGLVSQLRGRSEVWVVDEGQLDAAEVAVVVADQVDEETLRTIKALQRDGCPRVVVVVTNLDDGGLLGAIEAGACGLLRRLEAAPERLVAAIEHAAAGDGTLPPDVLGRLLAQLGHLHREVLSPRGFRFSGLTEREVEVLRMVAEGCNTAEIAGRLCYSERTIKNVIQDVITRFQLRNRSHAVAYALRQGLI